MAIMNSGASLEQQESMLNAMGIFRLEQKVPPKKDPPLPKCSKCGKRVGTFIEEEPTHAERDGPSKIVYTCVCGHRFEFRD